jgi:deazaflavin-dependent oxidoreductase (nitroreductase family)
MAKKYRVTGMTRLFARIMSLTTNLGLGRTILLTTTGRRSGEQRQVPVTPISEGGVEYIVSPYGEVGWVHNVRALPLAKIKKGRSVREVTLVEVTGEVPGLVKAYYEREAFARPFMDVPGDAGVEDFAKVAERFPVFRVEEKS